MNPKSQEMKNHPTKQLIQNCNIEHRNQNIPLDFILKSIDKKRYKNKIDTKAENLLALSLKLCHFLKIIFDKF